MKSRFLYFFDLKNKMRNRLKSFISLYPVTLVSHLLRRLDICHTSLYLDKIGEEYPDRDRTLGGLANLLALYNVESMPVQVEDKFNFLQEAEYPFIARLPEGNACIDEIRNGYIRYFCNHQERVAEMDRFVEMWTGVALLVEKKENSREPSYRQNRMSECLQRMIRFLLLVGILGIGGWLFLNVCRQDAAFIVSFFIIAVGCAVGWLLLSKQIGTAASVARKVCTAFTRHDGCETVLSTPAAKIGGVLSWSEIGFGFFLTNLAWMGIAPSFFPYLLMATGLSLPFTFWSIGYQKWVAREWCALCLLSQLILWTFFFFNWRKLSFAAEVYKGEEVVLVGFSYLFVIFTVNRIARCLEKHKRTEHNYKEANRIRMDEAVFKLQLAKQPHCPVDTPVSSILFGNPQSRTLLTIVTNPFCTHCAELHKELDALNYFNYSDVCVQYVFNSYSPDLQSIDRILVEVYFQRSEEEVKKVYTEWFTSGNRRPDLFSRRYRNGEAEESSFLHENRRHWDWMEENKIIKTPLILINGYRLPMGYSLRDLLFLNM